MPHQARPAPWQRDSDEQQARERVRRTMDKLRAAERTVGASQL
jgi:hypothetical protein